MAFDSNAMLELAHLKRGPLPAPAVVAPKVYNIVQGL
jgi:hypothetical protein